MKIELSRDGARYLLKRLEIDLNFYSVLAGQANCSAANKETWELVKELRDGLTEAAEA